MAMDSLIIDEAAQSVAPPSSDIIVVENLWRTYDMGSEQQVQALRGVDLDVEQGDFFALLGPNGAGKTTAIGIVTSQQGDRVCLSDLQPAGQGHEFA